MICHCVSIHILLHDQPLCVDPDECVNLYSSESCLPVIVMSHHYYILNLCQESAIGWYFKSCSLPASLDSSTEWKQILTHARSAMGGQVQDEARGKRRPFTVDCRRYCLSAGEGWLGRYASCLCVAAPFVSSWYMQAPEVRHRFHLAKPVSIL